MMLVFAVSDYLRNTVLSSDILKTSHLLSINSNANSALGIFSASVLYKFIIELSISNKTWSVYACASGARKVIH